MFLNNKKYSLMKSLLVPSILAASVGQVFAQESEFKDWQEVVESNATVFESLELERISEESGILTAKTKKEFLKVAPSVIKINGDTGPLLLRDDGEKGDKEPRDGIFTAVTQFDFSGLENRRKRLDLIQKETKDEVLILTFDQRKLVKKLPASRIEPVNFSSPIVLAPFGVAAAVNSDASLIIRHQDVVQDSSRTFNQCVGGTPGGVWTFRYLMEQMANTALTGVSASDFTRMWLTAWENNQSINGFNVPNRNFGIHSQIIDDWEAASGGPGMPLDLDRAPFQLLAIVNRVDLRGNTIYGGGDAGEARFVFGLIDASCNAQEMTIIFEYGIEKNSCNAVKDWGQQWADLDNFTVGTPDYNDALELITEQFVTSNAAPSKPNGSALNQLRTNEIAFAGPWELREFVISDSGWNQHFLEQDTVKQTPDTVLNGTNTLRDYVNANSASIIAETHQVPLRFPTLTNPFLGGNSIMPGGFFWDHAGIAPREARHKFSLNTCNGCHAGETNTGFTHIKPAFGIPAALSGFMTGISVPDAADGAPTRTFDEEDRRATDLDDLLNSSCLTALVRQPLLSVH